MRLLPLALWGLSCVVVVAAQAQVVRQLGPHVHGVTTVDIALDGDVLDVAVSAPAINMLGFERPPQTAQERDHLARVLSAWRQPAGWLQPADAAACALTTATVQPHGLDADQPHTGHADIDAHYRYRCSASGHLDHLDLHLTDRYPATHRVVVNLVLPDRQAQLSLEGDQFRVPLAP